MGKSLTLTGETSGSITFREEDDKKIHIYLCDDTEGFVVIDNDFAILAVKILMKAD